MKEVRKQFMLTSGLSEVRGKGECGVLGGGSVVGSGYPWKGSALYLGEMG